MVSEWKKVRLGDSVNIQRGYAFKSKDYREKGVFVLRVSNLTSSYSVSTENAVFVPETFLQEYKEYQLEEGDILLVMVGATTGKIARVPKQVLPALLNQNLWNLKPQSGWNKDFFFYMIQREIEGFLSKKHGSAREFLKQSEFLELEISCPSLPEQRKIAAILSSVDEAIAKTEAIIKQTEKVKKGLMQQLLTKGIGHTKFKKTEIGEIPEEWEVKSIDELVFVNPESLSNKTNEEYEFEYIDIGSVERTGKIGETVRYQFKNSPSRARRIVRTGDTIISTVRPYLRAFAFIDNKHDQKVCSTGFAVLRPKEKIDPVFLFQSILNDKFVEFLKSRMTGSNYPAVTATDIKEYKLGVPRDINEQTKIAKILAKYDEKLEIEEKSLEQLQTIKKGLMQVLLTGKVRVKVDNEVMSQ
jgi:type I restriction enzyme, S subunit